MAVKATFNQFAPIIPEAIKTAPQTGGVSVTISQQISTARVGLLELLSLIQSELPGERLQN